MADPYNGGLFRFEKEGRSEAGYNTDDPRQHQAEETSQSEKDNPQDPA